MHAGVMLVTKALHHSQCSVEEGGEESFSDNRTLLFSIK